MNTFRIAYLIDTIVSDTNGTEKQLLEIIRRLVAKKFTVFLICLRQSSWMRENQLPCPCFILDYKGFLKPGFPVVVHTLRRLIVENDLDVLHTFFEDSIFVASLATCNYRKKLVLLSSRRDIGLGEKNKPWYHAVFRIVLPYINRTYDGITANSYQVKQYVSKKEKTPADKITVLYNGVECAGGIKNKPAVFQAENVDIWIAIVASLTTVKRHDVLIRAIALLVKLLKDKKIKVIILGDGPNKNHLLDLVVKENIGDLLCFEGAVTNVADYLEAADIGVLCSDREGLPNAILEYMACGLPIIATAVGGTVELVDKRNGICIPPGNSSALANALFEIIQDGDRRKEMGQASRMRAQNDFSWHKSMDDLITYYMFMLLKKSALK